MSRLTLFSGWGGALAAPVMPAGGVRHQIARRLRGSISLISVDLFDTLLLFPPVPELRRFGMAAAFQHRALKAGGQQAPDAAALWTARLAVTKPAYDAVAAAGTGEVRLEDIWQAVCAAVGLPPTASAALDDGEMAMHLGLLRPNRPLAQALLDSGRRVVIVSDSPMSGQHLGRLVGALLPDLAPCPIYSSADHQATKRHGGLFATVCAHEGVDPAEVLHVGDNPWSDGTQARAAGMESLETPRGTLWRALYKARDRLVRRRLRRQGRLSAGPRLRHG